MTNADTTGGSTADRPRLLDLFCCEGGAAEGYHRAGFRVYGVDIDPKFRRRYPFAFHAGDALAVLAALIAGEAVPFTHPDGTVEHLRLADFAVIHASPPCQHYSITKHSHDNEHPDLIDPTRELLQASGLPYVMENVVGAPMPGALVLCGSEFGLKAYDPATGRDVWLKRHRLFESSVFLVGAGGCNCTGRFIAGRLRRRKQRQQPREERPTRRLHASQRGTRAAARRRLDDDARPGASDPTRLHRVHRRATTRRDRTRGGGLMSADAASAPLRQRLQAELRWRVDCWPAFWRYLCSERRVSS